MFQRILFNCQTNTLPLIAYWTVKFSQTKNRRSIAKAFPSVRFFISPDDLGGLLSESLCCAKFGREMIEWTIPLTDVGSRANRFDDVLLGNR